MRTSLRFVAVLLPLFAIALPSSASAQWRYPPIYPPYPAYRWAAPESNLRVNVKPKEASVYVDGFFAGRVDEFDGKFQRLHVLPGEHEIVVYLEGYRSLKQRLYLSPDSTRTIDGALEKLAPGEAQEPPPEPERGRMEPPDEGYRQPPQRPPFGRRGPQDQPSTRRAPQPEPGEPSDLAALSIRVQPGGSTVRIDGERWEGPSGDERLIVQVEEGHHTIEVERDGYDRFTTEIDVRRGETLPLNINLRRR